MMTRLHLPHAIVVRSHVCKATLLSSHWKRRSPLAFEHSPILVGRIFHPERSHGCCPVRATRGSLPCGRYVLAPLTGNKEGSKCLWHSELSLHQLGSCPTVFIPRWTTHPCILYQVCATRGARSVVAGISRSAIRD